MSVAPAACPEPDEQRRVALDLVLRRVRLLGRGRLRVPVVVAVRVVRAGVVALRLRDLECVGRVAPAVDAAVDLRVRVHRRERLTRQAGVLRVPTEHAVVDRPGHARADLTLVAGRHGPLLQVDAHRKDVERGEARRRGARAACVGRCAPSPCVAIPDALTPACAGAAAANAGAGRKRDRRRRAPRRRS